MPCYYPIDAWYSSKINPETGKRQITFSRSDALIDRPLTLPCGKCIGCRTKYSTQWALRCVHESQFYTHNCFITLTYNDDNLPLDLSLNKKHFTDFMKRFRKYISPIKIKYFMCGEYGDLYNRPHYHALIFGYDFPDKEQYKFRPSSILYTSKILEDLWPFGFNTIGDVNYSTANYCAQYAVKKVNGERAELLYGERTHPYVAMSKGIGERYFEKYQAELIQEDSVIYNGRHYPLPRYYDNRFSDSDLEQLKVARIKNIDKSEQTINRLRTREKVFNSKLNLRSRETYE